MTLQDSAAVNFETNDILARTPGAGKGPRMNLRRTERPAGGGKS
jgi:hypothetical protein